MRGDVNPPEPLTTARGALYVLGSAGFSIADRVLVTFALFYYHPPAGLGLPERLGERTVLGLTAFGAMMVLGRVVDAIADPLVAAWSDRSRAPLGRRRPFMLWSALPLAVATGALFFPPHGHASALNAVYLGVGLTLFFALFTLYVTPYLALIPELARDAAQRIGLTMRQAYAQLGGAAVVMIGGPALAGAMGGGEAGYRGAIVLLCALAGALMLLPALAVDERRHVARAPAHPPGLAASLRLTLRHRAFLLYLGGNVAYWFAFNVVSSAALYLTTVRMGADAAFQSAALAATFAVAGASFAIAGAVARRIGKRRTMLAAGVLFVLAMLLLAWIHDRASGLVVFALLGSPVGALLVLPNAMLADCADADARRSGSRREAMYFGAQGVLLKVNLGLSTAVLAGLMALFGRDPGADLGLRLAGPVAAVVVLAGMACFWWYPEAEVEQAAAETAEP
jgi:GPH family glycoside/pentoside/hexuronide:cation symporter